MLGCCAGCAWAADSDNEKISEYAKFWKSALAQSNGILQSELDQLIEVEKMTITDWNYGKTFNVSYAVKIGWVTVKLGGNLYINCGMDKRIRKITPEGLITTVVDIETYKGPPIF
jgi:hypothetical protein